MVIFASAPALMMSAADRPALSFSLMKSDFEGPEPFRFEVTFFAEGFFFEVFFVAMGISVYVGPARTVAGLHIWGFRGSWAVRFARNLQPVSAGEPAALLENSALSRGTVRPPNSILLSLPG